VLQTQQQVHIKLVLMVVLDWLIALLVLAFITQVVVGQANTLVQGVLVALVEVEQVAQKQQKMAQMELQTLEVAGVVLLICKMVILTMEELVALAL
jgi:hypothetical protein